MGMLSKENASVPARESDRRASHPVHSEDPKWIIMLNVQQSPNMVDRYCGFHITKNVTASARENPPRVVGAIVIQKDRGHPRVFLLYSFVNGYQLG